MWYSPYCLKAENQWFSAGVEEENIRILNKSDDNTDLLVFTHSFICWIPVNWEYEKNDGKCPDGDCIKRDYEYIYSRYSLVNIFTLVIAKFGIRKDSLHIILKKMYRIFAL